MADTSFDSIIKRLQQQQDTANAANRARLTQAKTEYDKVIAQYLPGSSFGAGVEADIERRGESFVAQRSQEMVSRGTFNTTARAGVRSKFEEEIASPARLSLESLRQDKLAAARSAEAGLVERVQDTGPSSTLISQLAQRQQKASGVRRSSSRISSGFLSISGITSRASKSRLSPAFGR